MWSTSGHPEAAPCFLEVSESQQQAAKIEKSIPNSKENQKKRTRRPPSGRTTLSIQHTWRATHIHKLRTTFCSAQGQNSCFCLQTQLHDHLAVTLASHHQRQRPPRTTVHSAEAITNHQLAYFPKHSAWAGRLPEPSALARLLSYFINLHNFRNFFQLFHFFTFSLILFFTFAFFSLFYTFFTFLTLLLFKPCKLFYTFQTFETFETCCA